MKSLNIFLILTLFNLNAFADVLKPALVELSIFENKIELQIILNLEAVLSEISTNLKNTNKAKNKDDYDKLRVFESQKLKQRFLEYQDKFLDNITLGIDGEIANLKLKSIYIDDIGYTKRGRKSILTYEVEAQNIQQIFWQYSQKYGDSAFRWRFFEFDKYTWNTWQITKAKIFINIAKFIKLTTLENLTKFIQTGFYHVIPLGFDHILFIIAMALSIAYFWKILVLVSSFTLAHTITLALASFDIIAINSSIIEPLIAISIVFIAIENLFFRYHHKRKILVVFIFGLLHGLGFAAMLKSFINESFISSLIGFNLGVEFAQILIVMVIIFGLFGLKLLKVKAKFITISVNIVIAILALIMFFERI